MKQLMRIGCLTLLLVLISSITAFADTEEVRETEGDAGITFLSDDEPEPEKPRAPESPGQPGLPGQPGPGGGGPEGRWTVLPQTGSVGSSASQSAGRTLLVGAILMLVLFTRREKESNCFCDE